ncbi:hypothetical protein SAMN05216226_10322 [Halovenus aranensis]|jgi:hypothetical protein|uniref:Diguanylate Cyclase and Two-component system sensory domain-containing protein n=1 Tax=Halovenus aranensis TaxID=890420 RepID=A0A1G8TGU9_9EURY|nr:hypothetical protein [Halovenus aranensis]SDJ39900.1 hypothetical protein SAMN05216226_10322 [Halovenus aranensis]
MPLEQFLDGSDAPERSIAVLNRTEPEPFQTMIENLFADQTVSVSEDVSEEYENDTVVLLEDGTVVASSPLRALQDAILMVNTDLFTTGTRSLEETTVPDVLDALAGTRFTLRGYPESDTEKLLLVLISRYIEKRAYVEGDGTLRSSFQRLSRIEDEQGTKVVYQRVAETAVDVHVYGQPGWSPSSDFPVVAHAGHGIDFRTSWFVIHDPPDGADHGPAALLAIELENGVWDGLWSYDPQFVDDLLAYITAKL